MERKPFPADSELFKLSNAEICKTLNHGTDAQAQNRAKLLGELTSLSKRLIYAKLAVEDLLTEVGMHEVSQAIYCIEWRSRYYASEVKAEACRKANVLQRVWWALRNK